jgi:hypothetical protein
MVTQELAKDEAYDWLLLYLSSDTMSFSNIIGLSAYISLYRGNPFDINVPIFKTCALTSFDHNVII